MNKARWFLTVVLFLSSLIVTAGFIHVFIGSTEDLPAMGRTQKLMLAERWQGQATTFVFGTSRAHQDFEPEVFDAELQGKYPTQTINLALLAGSYIEQRAIAKHVLARFKPLRGQACLAFMELNSGLNFPVIDIAHPQNINLFHPRAVNLYTPEAVRFVAQFSDQTISPISRAGRLGVALVSAAGNYMNLGMLAGVIQQYLPYIPEKRSDGSHDTDRGFPVFQNYEQDHATLEKIFAAAPDQPRISDRQLLPGQVRLMEELRAVNPAVQLVYLVTPHTDDLTTAFTYPDHLTVAGQDIPIFNLARPDLYPDLYERENWRDYGHLNPQGAALMTRLLAGQVTDWLGAHPAARLCGEE